MAENGRVHPDCVNASNPYHECGVACLEKIAQGKGRKEKKKSDNHNGVNEGWFSQNKEGERRAQPTCPKASNPYHKCEEFCSDKTGEAKPLGVKKESRGAKSCPRASNPYHKCNELCSNRTAEAHPGGVKQQSGRAQPCPRASNPDHKSDKFCSNGTPEANPQEVNKESGSILETALSFGRKKKEPESQQNSPRKVNNVPAVKAGNRGLSPPSTFSSKKEEEGENSQSLSSSQQHSDESYSEDHSFEKGQVRSPGPVPKSGNVTPGPPRSPTKINLACYKIPEPAERELSEKLHGTPKAATYPSENQEGKVTNGPVSEYLNFNFSGISRASEDTDEDEAKSVVSDSCVSVGKYQVRANVAPILQLVFDKYGDIASGSRLESASMRAYYLECLCFVVQELQTTPFKLLTKSKLREMLAVLKDVQSAQIDVSWLRDILNELAEAVDLRSQHQAAGEAKTNCHQIIESTKTELESMLADLAEKENAVADAKARVAETEARLSELELEYSQLNETISSIWPKVEKFHGKHLADDIL